jgi:hypothetical protein
MRRPAVVFLVSVMACSAAAQTTSAQGAIAGRVVTDGQPIGGFIINVLPVIGRDGRAVTQRGIVGRTADDGTYVVRGVRPGDYVIAASPLGREAATPRQADGRLRYGPTYHPDALDLQDARHVHVAGEPLTGIDITVQPAPTFAVTGVVVSGQGARAAGARLVIGWSLSNPGSGSRPAQVTFTDTAGTFRFDVPSDFYRLDVVLPSRTAPPGGSGVVDTDPDGRRIYVLPDSPRTTREFEVRGRPIIVSIALPSATIP